MPGKVYILGGGPAGLALADALSEKGQVFTLIEKEKQLGGLAKTIQWKQYGAHDLGPHKIFTQDKALLQRVRSLLPNDAWLTQKKISKIYLNGHYLPYPPSPFSLINVFGLPAFLKILFGFGVGKFKLLTRKNAPTSLLLRQPRQHNRRQTPTTQTALVTLNRARTIHINMNKHIYLYLYIY